MEAHAPGPLKFLHQPDLGLLLLRIGVGVVGIFHGSQKLFGIWEGKGVSAFAQNLEAMNVPMPQVSAWLAALAEFGGGSLILLGLFTRLASVPFAFTMAVAWIVAHKMSFLRSAGGSDFPFALMFAALALIFTGPGRFSLQALLFPSRTQRTTP